MIATQEKTIDGFQIAVTQLPAMKGLALWPRIMKIVAPALTQTAGALHTKTPLDIDIKELAPALESIVSGLCADDIEQLARILLETAIADGRPILPTIDILFQGKVLTLVKVLAFAIQVNYPDFLAVALDASQARALPRDSK